MRAIAAATLAAGRTTIDGASRCDDAEAALRVASRLGVRCEWRRPDPSDPASAERLTLSGAWPGRRATAATATPLLLPCGESALTLRLFAPIAATLVPAARLEATGTLGRRPVDMLEPPLQALGLRCSSRRGRPPLELRGRLRSGTVAVDGRTTSQVLSGLLMALPTATGDSILTVDELRSEGYVELTRAVAGAFGVQTVRAAGAGARRRYHVPGDQPYRATAIEVEGDWSGAAYLLVGGAIAGRVRVTGLSLRSSQPDRAILEALGQAGATVRPERAAVVVEAAPLSAFDFDGTDCPDLLPPLAALACFCAGTSRLLGARRLAHKESPRGAALRSELGKLGARIEIDRDALRIRGGRLAGGSVHAHGDHRIAMACAVAALGARGPVTIDGAGAVAKSYPAFFEHLGALGGTIC